VSGLVTVEDTDHDGVVVLTLRRADKRNALSIALRDAMSDELDRLAADDTKKVVVVTGEGDVFSAGFDLDEFADATLAERLWKSSDRWHHTIIEHPLPTVAAVNGAAYGGGFDLAVMCDVRVVAANAVFGHPEHAFSEVVYAPLHDLVGGAVARELALTGRRIGAEEARTLGLTTRVVAADDVVQEAIALAGEIAVAPRDVLVRMKSKIVRRAGITGTSTLEL